MTTRTLEKCCDAPQAQAQRPTAMFSPMVDIIERPEEWLLIGDFPGATAQDIDVDFDRGTLSIRASVQGRPGDGAEFLHREYGVGDFQRSFEIGDGINGEALKAEYRDGVLTLHLRKAEAAKARKIAVKAG